MALDDQVALLHVEGFDDTLPFRAHIDPFFRLQFPGGIHHPRQAPSLGHHGVALQLSGGIPPFLLADRHSANQDQTGGNASEHPPAAQAGGKPTREGAQGGIA